MGLDPSILHREHIAKMLDHATKQKHRVQTAAEATAKGEAKSERDLQDQICAYLTLRGVKRIVRSRMDRRTTNAVGTPDLIFVWRSDDAFTYPVAFEAKTRTGTLSDEQLKAAQEFVADGWNYYVIRSLDEVKKILDSL